MNLLRIILVSMIASMPVAMDAAAPEPVDPFELTIEENLLPPKTGNKQREALRQRMNSVYNELSRLKFQVTKSHDGLVVTASIPCSLIFAPNDCSAIMPKAEELLKPFLVYADKTDSYKIVISVHSDDTGSEEYRYNITEARANLICDYFESKVPEAAEAQTIIPYGLGHEAKLAEDDSIKNRSRNRRVEINIVPVK